MRSESPTRSGQETDEYDNGQSEKVELDQKVFIHLSHSADIAHIFLRQIHKDQLTTNE